MKAGFVGVLGLPNAGKSTLVNHIVGSKVSAVNRKAQTTRRRIIGVSHFSESQLLWVDSPGYVESDRGLNGYLNKEFNEVLKECDVALLVLNLDAKKFEDLSFMIDLLKKSNKPWVPLISKVDLKKMDHRISVLREALSPLKPFLWGGGKKPQESLIERLLENLPESSAPMYPEDYYTLQSQREQAEEFIRERCFENLHEEVPYGLTVAIRRFQEGKTLKIYADLVLNKENHRPIVVGEKGSVIKKIGQESRLLMEKEWGQRVFLSLHAAVKKGWVNSKDRLREFGYE